VLVYCGSGNPESLASSTHIGIVSYGHNWEEGTANIADGNWHFIVMTCFGTTKVNYVDGVLDSLQQTTLSGVARSSQIWIGGCPTAVGDAVTNLNGGLIDEVYMYSRALSQAEVTNLMNGVAVSSPAIPSGTDLTLGLNSSLVLSGSAQTVGSLSGVNASSIQLGAGSTPTALTLGTGASSTFAGGVSGSGSLTKIGGGSITLSGVNSYNSFTTISNGTVKFGQSDNTNYVATLGPILKLTFDQTNGGDIYIDDNGNLATNPIVAVNTGRGGAAMNGTLNGAGATIVGGGRYGNALSLNGTASVFINSPVTALDCSTNGASWTYALWIKTSTAGATYGYQGDGTWSSAMTTFYLNNNNSTSGGAKAGGVRWGDAWLTGTATLNNNAWHFVTITVSNGVKTIYVDGNIDAQTGSTGWNAAGPSSVNQFWIGQSPDAGDGAAPFNGLIDEVYVFNRALSQSEVQNIMANNTVVPTGIISGQLPATTPINLIPPGTLDLSGTSQTIASLSDLGSNGGTVTNSAGTPVTLMLSSATTNTFAGKIRDASSMNAVSLIKGGSGMQALNGANSYSGNTTVNGGALAFGLASLPANGIVSVTNGAVLQLNFSGTNQIGGLILNGTNKPAGVYSSVNSVPYLAGTGSLLIAAPVATNSPVMNFTNSSGSLSLSWPSDHTGWRLQVQTNSLTTGLGTNWVDVPSSTNVSQIAIPLNTSNNSVFYRLVYP
jgi:autotransporter-associated beta strand protein